MNALPQAPCPHCQQPVNWFSPGCFNCRQSIQWPAPQNQQQLALQQASVQVFQQTLAQLQQQQAQQQQAQQQQQPAVRVQAPQQARPVTSPGARPPQAPAAPQGPLPGGDLDGLLEGTRFDGVAYDPQAAEDVEGLLPASYAEFVPPDLPVERAPEVEETRVASTGPGFVTPLGPNEVIETTAMVVARTDAPVEALPELDRASFKATTAQAPEITPDVELERTQVSTENRPTRVRRAAKAEEGKRWCPHCGTKSTAMLCPSCGAPTKELAA